MSIGIDAAVVADHVVAVRSDDVRKDFRIAPTLAGLAKLTDRLAPMQDRWWWPNPRRAHGCPLVAAVGDAGCRIVSVANR